MFVSFRPELNLVPRTELSGASERIKWCQKYAEPVWWSEDTDYMVIIPDIRHSVHQLLRLMLVMVCHDDDVLLESHHSVDTGALVMIHWAGPQLTLATAAPTMVSGAGVITGLARLHPTLVSDWWSTHQSEACNNNHVSWSRYHIIDLEMLLVIKCSTLQHQNS